MKPRSTRSRRLAIEHLEDRCTPATFGNPWPDASHLTMSFAPDGTAASSRTTDLFETLDAIAPTAAWQREVYRAFQTWATVANINLGVVADGGQALGAPGLIQGDARFGDIRVSAYPMDPSVFEVASPFEATAGTWTGDIKVNSGVNFGIGDSNQVDLFSAMLHEFGHALGLAHSSDPASIMFEDYQGIRTGLSTGDIAAIQALYGPRQADASEGSAGNNSFSSATQLPLLNLGGVTSTSKNGDIKVATDKDYYKFIVPIGLGKFTVRLQTLGQSLLAPRLTVYNAKQQVVTSIVTSGPNGGNLEIALSGLQLLATYYVKVEGANSDVFGVGSYTLRVDTLPGVSGIVQTTGGVVDSATTLLNVDLHTNDSILTAGLLPQPFATANSRFDAAYRGSISDGFDKDFYKIKAPGASNTTSVMTVMGWGLLADGLEPRVAVFDAVGRTVAADVLVNEAGSNTIQIPTAKGGATYYVEILAADPGTSSGVGNYFLGVDFGPRAVVLENFAQDTLTAGTPQDFYDLSLNRTVLFHFNLNADTNGSPIDAAVRATIYDENDNAVFTMVAGAGDTVTKNVVLGPGTYRVRLVAATRDKTKALPNLKYVLGRLLLDDPVGPRASDTTTSPTGGTSSTGSTATTSSSGPKWSSSGSTKTLSPSDPYSNPYSGA